MTKWHALMLVRYPLGDAGLTETMQWSYSGPNRGLLRLRAMRVLRETKTPANPPWWQFWKPRVWTLRIKKVK